MTIAVFLGSLLAAMALGVPIAFSLLLCGSALMWHMDMFDAQILARPRPLKHRMWHPLLNRFIKPRPWSPKPRCRHLNLHPSPGSK